ncbi:hypothetical protein BG844_33810 [Couchioplanes caeruleus subsp. caeruleus]|uniref:Uncharacterized protein n=1 Tax=Couchioplanes caeruleus subsp. caeruleus TaxID=56427 RepID=A0A1K0FBA9_9ACTN|nr:hypothetical protein BG844_33810 [Couchioplanes caeruleus subsp. caeruleus]
MAPPNAPAPRRRRSPASLRHIAEVIRTHRLAPGATVDKDAVAQVLAGDHRIVVDPIPVIAVMHACRRIAGRPFEVADAAQIAAASARITALIEAAKAADVRAPRLLPAPRPPSALARVLRPKPAEEDAGREFVIDARPLRGRDGWPTRAAAMAVVAVLAAAIGALVTLQVAPQFATSTEAEPVADRPCAEDTAGDDLVRPEVVGPDSAAQVIEPFLDFDEMNGSARYNRYRGRTYYWGRAGSDDNVPQAGGARIRWQKAGGPWHDCPVTLAVDERDYVRTPAVATTIGGEAVRVQVCLWRQQPYRQNCTMILS